MKTMIIKEKGILIFDKNQGNQIIKKNHSSDNGSSR